MMAWQKQRQSLRGSGREEKSGERIGKEGGRARGRR